MATTIARKLPSAPDPRTNETYHSSVLRQHTPPAAVQVSVKQYPELLQKLMPLEEQLKQTWPFDPDAANGDGESHQNGYMTAKMANGQAGSNTGTGKYSILSKAREALMRRARNENSSDENVPNLAQSGSRKSFPIIHPSEWVKKVYEESSWGEAMREIVDETEFCWT